MDEENKFWLMACIMVTVFILMVLLTACKTQTKYITPSGVSVELPHTPADSVKGGGR